tara:strand:+ start:270799 stop:271638 length:840 start_codon:yes stop_codon:yes gene_type:complete
MSKPSHSQYVIEHTDAVVRVVQFTDSHLCRQRGGTLLGMDTDHSLQAVLDLIKRERPVIDLLLGTGDLADGGARGAYERLQAYCAQFSCDSFWVPGNHDDRVSMESVATAPGQLSGDIRMGKWQILLLDTQVPGEVGGELGAVELEFMRAALERAAEQDCYTLICLHHQPVQVGCDWLDQQMVSDASQFFATIDQFPGVRGVLWGHVHQEIDRERNGVRLLASPSTCVQFAPNSVNFKADDRPPGYRWLDLHADGRISTAVSRVTDVEFTVDLESGGYL